MRFAVNAPLLHLKRRFNRGFNNGTASADVRFPLITNCIGAGRRNDSPNLETLDLHREANTRA